MYRFTVYSHVWDWTFKSSSKKFPEWEFIEVKNAQWDTLYMNRNQILFYEVKEIKDENKKENTKDN